MCFDISGGLYSKDDRVDYRYVGYMSCVWHGFTSNSEIHSLIKEITISSRWHCVD